MKLPQPKLGLQLQIVEFSICARIFLVRSFLSVRRSAWSFMWTISPACVNEFFCFVLFLVVRCATHGNNEVWFEYAMQMKRVFDEMHREGERKNKNCAAVHSSMFEFQSTDYCFNWIQFSNISQYHPVHPSVHHMKFIFFPHYSIGWSQSQLNRNRCTNLWL